MAFWGHSFVFNDIPCENFDLMLYDIGNNTQSSGTFASGVSIVEDKTSTRYKPFFYGTKMEDKLSFELVFGVNERRIDEHQFLDRYELDAVATWLTGKGYQWLEVQQDDLEFIRYRCIVTKLQIIEYGLLPWALKASVECDGPYAYMYPREYTYEINGPKTIDIYNESSHNGYYLPEVMFDRSSDTLGQPWSLSISNSVDIGHDFTLTGVPNAATQIYADSDSCTLWEGSASNTNLYDYFNFKFLRLIPGWNHLTVTGNGTLTITCEFPVNVGA